ncbi:hypothetical protein X971_0866 [Agrobacterium tumefaciens LBA4213 (Ach5)]|nr:hypothetical protein X971_0866 [Agrobacterium tumefaciens LBA4213 (Ach5)]
MRAPPSVLPDISPSRGEIGKTRHIASSARLEWSEALPQVDLPP